MSDQAVPTGAISPALASGFRDALPGDEIYRQELMAVIAGVYESFGFVPIDTPCMERPEVLLGTNPSQDKSTFRARIVRGVEDRDVEDETMAMELALRFDLTVPLAAFIARHPELARPFKRYHVAKVWRGEKAQAGRYREFWQCDFDTIGAASIEADIETIQIMYEVMRALGIERFVIRFNSRKVLNGLADLVGCTGDKVKEMFRIIDKLDKIGLDGVIAELQRQPDNEFDETALAMSDENAQKVREFLGIKSQDPQVILAALDQLFGQDGSGRIGWKELTDIVAGLKALVIPDANWCIDLSVARGLDYYTGPVFETTLLDAPEFGSVMSGGRFDGLTERFIADSNIAGVGASVGLDRLIAALDKLQPRKKQNTVTEVLVAYMGDLSLKAMTVAQELRRAGIRTEVYLGEDPTPRAQLAYARKQDMPWVVFLGPDEVAKNLINLKDMATRQQEALTVEAACARILASRP
ncbi:MAG: histidine--tRNA ligase [Patescibacteria group bacterium]